MSEPTSSSTSDESAAAPALKYEAARDELIEVVKQLEGGGLTLEQSIALWERGEELADICQAWLDGAKARLLQATEGDHGDE